MEIQIKQGSIADQAVDLIVVNLFQGITRPGGATGAVDGALNGAIQQIIAAGDFTGKSGETALLYSLGALPAPRLLIVGLGEQARFNAQVARDVSATAARKARDLNPRTVATAVHGAGAGGLRSPGSRAGAGRRCFARPLSFPRVQVEHCPRTGRLTWRP